MRLSFYSILIGVALLGSCNRKDKSQEKMVNLNTGAMASEDRINQLTQAIDRDPNNGTLLAQRAKVYLDTKQPAKALADAERAITLDKTKGEYHFLKARAQRGLNRLEAALGSITQAEQNNYAESDLYILRGEIFIIVKQYQKAIDNLNQALKLTPFNEYAYFYKGILYGESGDTARAISNLQTSIEQAPEFIEPYNELAKIHTAKKNFREANQYLQSGLRYAPADPFLHYNQGVNLVSQRLDDSAAVSFRKALQGDTSMFRARYNLGVIHYNRNRYPEAVAEFEKLQKYADQLPNVALLLADSYDKAGRREEAIEQYKKVVETSPDNEFAQNALRRLSRPAARNTARTDSLAAKDRN